MNRKEEIELLIRGLISDLKEVLRNYPTLEVDEIIKTGKQLEKYERELEKL